jgi:tetratricopeptide (TPR) repeat protein
MKKPFIFLSIIIMLVALWFILAPVRAKKANNYLVLGDQQIAEKNYPEAILAYKKADVLTPGKAQISLKIGEGYNAAGDIPKSIDYLEKAQSQDPKNKDIYLKLADVLSTNNQQDLAISYLEKGINQIPFGNELYLELGKIYLTSDDPQKALDNFEKINSDDKNYYSAVALSFSQKWDEARDLLVDRDQTDRNKNLLEAIDKIQNTKSPNTQKVILAQTLNLDNDSILALPLLKEVTNTDPKYRDAWVFLGYTYLSLNDYNNAEKALNAAADIDPTYSLTFELLARTYQSKGDQAKADENSKKAEMLK